MTTLLLTFVTNLDSQRQRQILENRARMRTIIESIIFLGRQNVPLRGHRDDGCLFDQDSGDVSRVHVNEGNFLELLRFRVNAGDETLADHL